MPSSSIRSGRRRWRWWQPSTSCAIRQESRASSGCADGAENPRHRPYPARHASGGEALARGFYGEILGLPEKTSRRRWPRAAAPGSSAPISRSISAWKGTSARPARRIRLCWWKDLPHWPNGCGQPAARSSTTSPCPATGGSTPKIPSATAWSCWSRNSLRRSLAQQPHRRSLSRASKRERGTHRAAMGGEGFAGVALVQPSPGRHRYAAAATLSRFNSTEAREETFGNRVAARFRSPARASPDARRSAPR